MRKLAVTVVVLLGLSIVASTQDYPRFVAKLALKNQTADIPVTTLFTPKVDSFYRVSTYLVVAIPGGKDNDSRWLGQVLYTDDAGPETGPGESVTSCGRASFRTANPQPRSVRLREYLSLTQSPVSRIPARVGSTNSM